jgi:hypothetical protein
MKAHVEAAEGRWLPSRYRYALFRLTAFLLLRKGAAARSEPPGGRCVLILDRDQNPIESFALSLFVVVWSAACVSISAWYAGVSRPAAIALFAIVVAITPIIIQLVLYLIAGARAALRKAGAPFSEANYEVQSAAFFLLMLGTAIAAAISGQPALEFLGWIWLGLLMLNGAAAILMRLVAQSVAAAEAQLRETPSDL